MKSTNYELKETPWKESERRLLYFTCPACGGYLLHEFADGLWSSREIRAVRANGAILYGANHVDCDRKRSFRCRDCGYEIENNDRNYLSDGHFLAEWLIAQESKTRKL